MAVMVEEPILESTIDLTKSTINTTKRSATDALTTPVPPKMKKIGKYHVTAGIHIVHVLIRCI